MTDATAADAAAIATGTPPAASTPPAGTPAAPASGTPPATPAQPAAAAPTDDTKPKEQPQGAPPVVPDRYDLKLPDDISVDPTVVDRTAAIARELGLSQDNAQKALGFVAQEVAAQTAARVEELVKSHQPGGAEWKATEEKWRAESLADPVLGGGKPEVFDQNKKLANQVAARYGTEGFVKLLNEDPMGSHPEVMKFLVAIGKASKESDLVKPDSMAPPSEKSREEVIKDWYPKSPELAAAPR